MTTRSHSCPKRLYRSRRNRVLTGVCGGLAEYLDFSPGGMRIGLVLIVIFTVITLPFAVILYLVMSIVLKPEPEDLPRFGLEGEVGPYVSTRAEALQRVQQRYERLEQRLQRMESIVTRPEYELNDELHRL